MLATQPKMLGRHTNMTVRYKQLQNCQSAFSLLFIFVICVFVVFLLFVLFCFLFLRNTSEYL